MGFLWFMARTSWYILLSFSLYLILRHPVSEEIFSSYKNAKDYKNKFLVKPLLGVTRLVLRDGFRRNVL